MALVLGEVAGEGEAWGGLVVEEAQALSAKMARQVVARRASTAHYDPMRRERSSRFKADWVKVGRVWAPIPPPTIKEEVEVVGADIDAQVGVNHAAGPSGGEIDGNV